MFTNIKKLLKSDGLIEPGSVMISGVIVLFLSILCCFGVLAFHFPDYLTMPELRRFYDVNMMSNHVDIDANSGKISLI